MRFALAFCLAMTLLTPIPSEGAERKEGSSPWIATAGIFRKEGPTGSGVYLKSGLIITAAHLTDAAAKMGVRIAGISLPAEVLKQGSLEDVDFSLLLVDQENYRQALSNFGCHYVRRHLGQAIRLSLWTLQMPRGPTSSRRRCCP